MLELEEEKIPPCPDLEGKSVSYMKAISNGWLPAITIEEYEFGLGKWFNNRFFVLLFRKLGDRKISKAFIIEVKDTETTILPCNADPKILEQVKNEVIPGLVSLMITVLSFPLIELLFAWNVHRHQKLLKL